MKMKKTLIIVAAAVSVAGPAMAGGKTFDEIFPAPRSSVEDFCANLTINPSDHRRENACIDSAQTDYDYAKRIWSALGPARQEACSELWDKYAAEKVSTRAMYRLISGCLTNQLTAQTREIDRETVHHFKAW
jgi:hypothetical protein